MKRTNYTVNVPGRPEKSQIYHINLSKPYLKEIELINFMAEKIKVVAGNRDLK